MAVTLNERGYARARKLIEQGRYVLDGRDAWSEHQPSTEKKNEFIAAHGIGEYAKWHLGVDDEEPPERKAHFKFPYGDFDKVHRCGVLSAEVRAGQYKHADIERAAAHLHGMLEALRQVQSA
ncbi:hypothetical protein ACQP2P_34635 [Dactylosporangium sp. CA-139114]|uniref:hypothetical protein n=1 Tax=Dactylosporangium sp. CA-139114 TaxID=3239931 RepID=UPI003D990E59